jgi:hypothetical protein
VKENEVGVGIAGANLRVRRWAKVFREEIESETRERHLTCPPNVFLQFLRWGYPAWWNFITAALETLSAALIVLPETRIWGLALGAMVLIAAVSTVTWHREYEHFPPGVALAALTGIGDKHGDRSNIDAREHGADGL